MTQIVFMLFEDMSQNPDDKSRYRVDVHFSPGVKTRKGMFEEGDAGVWEGHGDHCSKTSPELPTFVKRLLNDHVHEHTRTRSHGLLLSKSAPGFKSTSMSPLTDPVSFSDSENTCSRSEEDTRRVSMPCLKSKSETGLSSHHVGGSNVLTTPDTSPQHTAIQVVRPTKLPVCICEPKTHGSPEKYRFSLPSSVAVASSSDLVEKGMDKIIHSGVYKTKYCFQARLD